MRVRLKGGVGQSIGAQAEVLFERVQRIPRLNGVQRRAEDR